VVAALPDGLRRAVSSLMIHHLDGPGKAAVFRDLHAKLVPGRVLPNAIWSMRRTIGTGPT